MNKQSIWNDLPQESRKIIINIFGGYGIDFEKNFIENEPVDIGAPRTPLHWITRKAAAEYAGVSLDTIDNWCHDGKIESIKTAKGRPGSVRIDYRSLQKFLTGMKRKHKSACKRMGVGI